MALVIGYNDVGLAGCRVTDLLSKQNIKTQCINLSNQTIMEQSKKAHSIFNDIISSQSVKKVILIASIDNKGKSALICGQDLKGINLNDHFLASLSALFELEKGKLDIEYIVQQGSKKFDGVTEADQKSICDLYTSACKSLSIKPTSTADQIKSHSVEFIEGFKEQINREDTEKEFQFALYI